MKNPQFELGLRFQSAKVFREAARRHSVLIGRQFRFKQNDKTTVKIICVIGRPFLILAANVNKFTYLQVKTFVDKYTCGMGNQNSHANAPYLAKWFQSKLTNAKWDVGQF